MTAPLGALDEARSEELADIRAALERAEYTDAALSWTESIAPRQLDAVRAPLVRWGLRAVGEPWAVCARLFAYDDTVSDEELENALSQATVARLRALSIVQDTETGLRARFRILPFHGLLVLSDRLDGAADAVMGPGATTAHLANAVAFEPGTTVLDVGCGAGTLGLLAAKSGATVTATDLDPRAIAIARVNARLNGLECELLEGDLTAPVRGREFDLVVSQPPFVFAPTGVVQATFLHGGARGDELAMRLVGELPSVLAPGGIAVLRLDVPVLVEPLSERLHAALGPAEASVLVLAARGPTADRAAIAYAALIDPTLGEAYAEAVGRYRGHLASAGIESITSALVQIRRDTESQPGWTAVTAVSAIDRVRPDHLARVTRGMDAASEPDGSLLARRIQLSPDARLMHATDLVGVHEEERIVFTKTPFAEHSVSLAANVLLAVFAQPTPVKRAVEEYADACEAEPREVQDQVLAFVRESLARGLLVA